LQADTGKILFNPREYAQRLKQLRLTLKRNEELRRAAKARSISKRETREVEVFELADHGESDPDQIIITDVSIKLRFSNQPLKVISFADIFAIWKVYPIDQAQLPARGVFKLKSGESVPVVAATVPEAEKIRSVFVRAYQDWSLKFPRVAHAQIQQ
jgi:hypothetical protein